MFSLYLVVFIGLTGVGIIIPLFPFFGEQVGASPAEITMLMAVFALGQFVAAPIWGWWSDRVGRKPVFIITLAGSAVAYLMLGLAETVPALLVSRLVGGLMAGNIPVAFAAASDVTSGEDRSKIMGRVGAAFSLGFIFGPAIGGLLAGPEPQASNFLVIAMLAAGLCLFAVIVTIIFFKETHPRERRSAKPVSLRLISLKGAGRYLTLPVLGALIGVNFIFVAGASMMDSTFALYAFKEHGFGPSDIGFLFTYMGVVMAIVQGGTIGPLTKKFGDAKVLRAGLFVYITGLGLMVVATGLYSVLLSLTFLTVGNALFVPSSSSLASQHAPGAEQGAALGVFQAAGNLGRVLTPAFSGVIFATYGTTAPFVVAIVLISPTLLLIALAIRQAAVVSVEPSS
ncbi:MAG: MFS transporter [Rhodospirillaceae bacterium]|nr:MFS transporter [Rhodospirillaceae bacterium]